MGEVWYREYRCGRCILARFSGGEDLIGAIGALCSDHRVDTAAFTLSGTLASATYGVYDPDQQVYVTESEELSFEILSGSGTVCRGEKTSFVWANLALADRDGRVCGGRIFTPTKVFAVEIMLRELVGERARRTYDDATGLPLWC
jgi:predicted DNA-binding protein with PD1-like motif